MKLLVSYPKVKEIVMDIRSHLNIPEDGLKSDQIKSWHKKNDIKSDEVMNSPKFVKQEEYIRKNWREKNTTPNEAKKILYELYLQISANYLNDQIWKIIRQFNVPDNYKRHIYEYILLGTITAPIANYSIGPFLPGEKFSDVRRVPITVYAKLTDKDLRDLKIEVNKLFGSKRLTFIQNTKNIDRGLEIEKLVNEKKYDPLSDTYYKLSNEEIAEEVLGSVEKKKDIPKIRKSLEKLKKRRYGHL